MKATCKVLVGATWAMLATLSVAPNVHSEELTLSLIHTNDFHARLEPVTIDGSRCRPADATEHRCYGGIARIATEIAVLRRAQPNNTVLVDAGDRFQGSLFYNTYKGSGLKPFFELLGYQAMTLGNHEFDDGPAELGHFLTGLTVPVISANVDVQSEETLVGRIAPTLILPVAGQRVGLIGLTTPSTATNAKPGVNVHFTDPVAAARAAVTTLHEQKVNHIVVISHLGEAEDEKLAAAVDGIGVIIGGHSHTLLRDGDARSAGPAPRVVKSPSGNPVLIVQAYFAGIYLGYLQVTFDDAGVPRRWQGKPVLLDDSIAQDNTVKGFVEALAVPLAAQYTQKIAETKVALDGGSALCRFGECNLGDVIAESMLSETSKQKTQIAIINGGSIRTSLAMGDITMGEVLEVLPFANTISTFELTGANVAAALEHGVSHAENPSNASTGRFPQVAGLRYTWDAAAEINKRVVSVQVRQADGSYVDLVPETIYHVATVDFLRTGGDDYTVFRDHAINAYDGGALVSDALTTWLSAHTPITTTSDGRITRKN